MFNRTLVWLILLLLGISIRAVSIVAGEFFFGAATGFAFAGCNKNWLEA